MAITFDVRICGIRTYRGKKKTTHTVRWTVAGKEFPETFATKGLAEASLGGCLRRPAQEKPSTPRLAGLSRGRGRTRTSQPGTSTR